jgi:phosphoglycerate dehydrogenase-like enzyme
MAVANSSRKRMVKILIASHPINELDVAQAMLPADLEATMAPYGSTDFAAALPQAVCMVGSGDGRLDDSFYRSAPKLKLVQLLSAGYDTIDIEAARRAGVAVCNNGGANSTAVAEATLLLMLAVARRLPMQHGNTAAGRWRGNYVGGTGFFELKGRKLGIVGLGAIGKKTARLARAFGMTVIYFDIRRLTEDQADAFGVQFALFDEVLRTADIVTLHVPLTPLTRHMMGRAQFRLMKPDAVLINTCRGPVVDEEALCEALTDGTIAAAGLDVFEQEPTRGDNPLLQLDNVVLTPHLAGGTMDSQYTRFRNAFDNCQRVARGDKPLWVIPELAD